MTIRSLDDYKKKERDAQPMSSYAGGEKSGIAVDHPDENNVPAVTITVYSNGFCINDGGFRSFDIEANREYLKAIREGTALEDLAQYAKNGEVSVALRDKSSERFDIDSVAVPPTEPVLFVGAGRTLRDSSSEPTAVKPPTVTNVEVSIDVDEPTTTLQFRFHNGTRIRQSFNVTSTVGDVFHFVTSAANIPSGFELVTGFPGKPIHEPMTKSLQECGLLNSTVTQRPLKS